MGGFPAGPDRASRKAVSARVVYAGRVTVPGRDQLFSEVDCMKSLKRKTAFPDAVTLKRVREKLSDPNYPGGNLALPENATEVDRAKYQLCQVISKQQREHGLLQKDIARKIGVDESRVSDIPRGSGRGFTPS